MPRLSQIDANLLVALDVLLEEQHVTRAARRLGVTQSAMSQTLGRLRETLGDPILVRAGGKMVATPRAEAIMAPLRAALIALDQTLQPPQRFEPAAEQHTFRFSCLDTYAMTVLPGLFQRLADAGEQLDMDVLPMEPGRIWERLRSGDVELAIIGPWDPPADIRLQKLYREQMVSMVRANHPILDEPITLERFAQWPHTAFRITGRGRYWLDGLLEARGVTRRVVGRTPYFLASPAYVASTDLIVTVPRSAAQVFAEHWPVTCFESPLDEPWEFDIHMAWPMYLEADPAHRWLREQVLALAPGLLPD